MRVKNRAGSRCCCVGTCDLLGQLIASDTANPHEYNLTSTARDLATGLPGNDWYIEFEIMGMGSWEVLVEVIDDTTSGVLDTAEFSRDVNTASIDADLYSNSPDLIAIDTTARYHARINASEATESHLVVTPSKDFAARLDRVNESWTIDHDRPEAVDQVSWYPPDSSRTVEAPHRATGDAVTLSVTATSGTVVFKVTGFSSSQPPFDFDIANAPNCFTDPGAANPTCPPGKVTCTSTRTGRHLDASFTISGTWANNPGYFWGAGLKRVEAACSAQYGIGSIGNINNLLAQSRSFRNVDDMTHEVGATIYDDPPYTGGNWTLGGEVSIANGQTPATSANLDFDVYGMHPMFADATLSRDTLTVNLGVQVIAAGAGNLQFTGCNAIAWQNPGFMGFHDNTVGAETERFFLMDASANPAFVELPLFQFGYTLQWAIPLSNPNCTQRPFEATQTLNIVDADNYSAFLSGLNAALPGGDINSVLVYTGLGAWDIRDNPTGYTWLPGFETQYFAQDHRYFWSRHKFQVVSLPQDQTLAVTLGNN